ncbi:MAG: hypothetical protein NZ772_16530 [Cyanobacteria bacterium]|nr:hypothetical protein [Cyanobacteriota bacterium]MDW8202861.1 hypothetical protein [Cyanobacteriota bacterium SKYGB_h_bin112]
MSIVYWSYGSGLANRLRALVGYMVMSHVLEQPFYLCWVPDIYCDAEFTDLFVAPSTIKLITQLQKDEMELDQNSSIYTSDDWFYEIWKTHVSSLISANEFCSLANTYLRGLLPVSSITNAVNKFCHQYSIPTLPGIHIRLTDNVSQFKIWQERSPYFKPENISKIEGFERFICDVSKQESNPQLFLATDNQKIERYLKSSFPGQIITYPKRFRPDQNRRFSWKQQRFESHLQRTSSIKEALIELLILSRCKTIVGTYWSSYSQISACLGVNSRYFQVIGDSYAPHEHVEKLRGNIPF